MLAQSVKPVRRAAALWLGGSGRSSLPVLRLACVGAAHLGAGVVGAFGGSCLCRWCGPVLHRPRLPSRAARGHAASRGVTSKRKSAQDIDPPQRGGKRPCATTRKGPREGACLSCGLPGAEDA